MRAYGKGILPESQIFFFTPQEAERSAFLYPLCVGLYQCDTTYIVDRQNYDSFLLMYLARGTGFLQVDGVRRELKAGSFALLDCYHPHVYGSTTGCQLLWTHFDGAQARAYYDYIAGRGNGLAPAAADSDTARRYLERLFGALHDHRAVGTPLVSKYLVGALTEFMIDRNPAGESDLSEMERARIYITENLDKSITLEDIAAQANLSVYYFTRRFKKEFGCTPHEYLLRARLKTARFYLESTALPVKEIAWRCGFGNECNFCTCFRKNIGCTPASYRAMSHSE